MDVAMKMDGTKVQISRLTNEDYCKTVSQCVKPHI